METRVANGTIVPSTFVVLDSTTAGGRVLAASGTTLPIFGVAQAGTRNAPYPGLDDGNAALVNESLTVYTFPDKEVPLIIGSGGCNPGDRLTSDSNGAGIVTTTTGNFYGAIAKQSGNAGQIVMVDMAASAEY